MRVGITDNMYLCDDVICDDEGTKGRRRDKSTNDAAI
jgi:hypothetical protein